MQDDVLSDILRIASQPTETYDRFFRKCCLKVLSLQYSNGDASAFWDTKLSVLRRFFLLSPLAQLVAMRIYARKTEWYLVKNFEVKDAIISADEMIEIFEQLNRCEFVEPLANGSGLDAYLGIMDRKDLEKLAKELKIINTRSMKKPALTKKISDTGWKQQSLYSKSNMTHRSKADCGTVLSDENRSLRMIELGEKKTIKNCDKVCRALFYPNQEELCRYVTAKTTEQTILRLAKADDKKILPLIQDIHKSLAALARPVSQHDQDRHDFYLGLPDWNLRFFEPWVLTRCMIHGMEAAQRLRQYSEACITISFLLESEFLSRFCRSRRGALYERWALNIGSHLKMRDQGRLICERGLRDPLVAAKDLLSLQDRGLMLCRNFEISIELSEPEKVEIVCSILQKNIGNRRTNQFIRRKNDAEEICSVEQIALDHFIENGFAEGVHAEGAIWHTIFGILFFDISNQDKEGQWISEMQIQPLDQNSANFYSSREEEICSRINEIRYNSEATRKRLLENYGKYFGIETSEIDWNLFTDAEQLDRFFKCLPPLALAEMCKRFAMDNRNFRSGLPDLTVWNALTSTVAVIEVKGPGDRLSTKQRLWLDFWRQNGVRSVVCYVKGDNGRRL